MSFGLPSIGAVWLAFPLALAAPAAAQTSVSIYSDGRAVIRLTLPQALAKGHNTVRLPLERLDTPTLFSPDADVAIVSAEVRPATTQAEALERSVGRTLPFVLAGGDTITATVLHAEPPQFRLPNGSLMLAHFGQPLFPADVVRSSPEVVLVLEAKRARPRAELAYVTQGATWEALYQLVVADRGSMVSGTATLRWGAGRVDSTEVQLVAGRISQVRHGMPVPDYRPQDRMGVSGVVSTGSGFAREQNVGETHVYDLPGRVSLEAGAPVSVALFPPGGATVARELVVPGAPSDRGRPAAPATGRVPVEVWYTLSRGRGTPFGDRPLPAGTVQLYERDAAGRVLLVGEATVGHTPAGRDLQLLTGQAFDVGAERQQTDHQRETLPPRRPGLPGGSRDILSFEVTLTNAKREAVTVNVYDGRPAPLKVLASSAPAEQLSDSDVRFRVTVPAGGTATLTYTLQMDARQ